MKERILTPKENCQGILDSSDYKLSQHDATVKHCLAGVAIELHLLKQLIKLNRITNARIKNVKPHLRQCNVSGSFFVRQSKTTAMPINYKEYHPKWKLISKLIRVNRAKGKCEWCGIKNGAIVKRKKDGTFREPCQTDWDMIHSRIKYSHSNMTESLKYHGFTKIVLTVAHIDQDKTNNRFDNLAALCQKCHLSHDIKQHIDNRKYGRNWKGKHQMKLPINDR